MVPRERFAASQIFQHQRPAVQVTGTENQASEDEMLALLATDGMLVKRPLLVGEGFVLVGFRAEEWKEKL